MSPAELYSLMRLTRSLEERLVTLKRQGRVPGGVYRSLGQEGSSVGAAAAMDFAAGDIICPLIRGLGAVLTAGGAAGHRAAAVPGHGAEPHARRRPAHLLQ